MSKGTILAVDDEPDILIALEDLFEDEYRVLTSAKPEDALEILRADPDIAVVVSDQRMPGMTGDALLAEARSFHEAQAILLTGYADISAVIAALNRGGIIGYVAKPWDPTLLRATVRNAYERHRLGRDLATERALLRGLLDHAEEAISFKDAQGRFVRLNARKAGLVGSAVEASLGRTELEVADTPEAREAEAADRRAIAAGEAGPTVIARGAPGAIAHGVSKLLTAFLGRLERVGPQGADQPRVKRLVDNATGAAQRGSALTKRLLSFSRSNDAHARPVDPNALIEGMSALFGSSLGSLVHVVRDLEPDMPFALVDPDQLELAVLNLCINARDAMPDGGTVTISTRRAEIHDDPDLKPGTYAVVTVADEGTGIPPEILERVCEPFFTTKAVGQGTGLGLAMVFGLAQQAGGRLRITSEVGQGTRIELALPRADGTAERTEAEVLPAVPTAASPARILVVDDDAEVRHVTASFLNDFGYDETEAADGRAALALMEQGERFDLVVADRAMPGMTGVELAAAIRQRFSGVPVLLLTGHAEAVQIPADLPVMTKPFASAELAARVSQLLENPT